MHDSSVSVVVTCVSPCVMIVCETVLKKCFEPKLINICTLQAILSHQTIMLLSILLDWYMYRGSDYY